MYGLTVGFVAFTCLGAPGSFATAERPGVAAIRVHSGFEVNPLWQIDEPGEPMMVTIRTRVDEHDCQAALSHIQSLRAKVDVLCVSIHWGTGPALNWLSTSASWPTRWSMRELTRCWVTMCMTFRESRFTEAYRFSIARELWWGTKYQSISTDLTRPQAGRMRLSWLWGRPGPAAPR